MANVLRLLPVVASLLLPSAALAECRFVGFNCKVGKDADGSPVISMTDLRSLQASGKSARWIQKNCWVSFREPDGCNWRASGGGTVSQTTVVTSTLPPSTYGSATPPARRDAKGRLGPTMAPPREEVAPASLPDEGVFATEIAAAATRFKLPPHLIRAVMMVESGGNPLAVSHKGALGVMQMLPATAQAMGVDDPHDVAQSIMGGARFLRVLANRFDGDLVKVLSAYHAGSTRVLGRDATPFAATDDYVRKVLKLYYQLRDAAARKGG